MSKSLFISGTFVFICLLAIRVISYFEGMAFNVFWSIPMVVVPVLLFALLTFFILSIVCAIAVARKKRDPKNLVFVGLIPVLVIVLYQLPLPNYVDGMHKTLAELLTQKELIAFAIDARSIGFERANWKEREQLIQQLRAKHTKALSLSSIPPRIDVSEKYISVFYGSALTKHWGFVLGDLNEFPISRIPENMYKQVYEGVWVYHDIW